MSNTENYKDVYPVDWDGPLEATNGDFVGDIGSLYMMGSKVSCLVEYQDIDKYKRFYITCDLDGAGSDTGWIVRNMSEARHTYISQQSALLDSPLDSRVIGLIYKMANSGFDNPHCEEARAILKDAEPVDPDVAEAHSMVADWIGKDGNYDRLALKAIKRGRQLQKEVK